jgi:hypothetical protein
MLDSLFGDDVCNNVRDLDPAYVSAACRNFLVPSVSPEKLKVHLETAEFSLDLPTAGLGLECVPEPSYSHQELGEAIRAVTVPPAIDLGLHYPVLPGGGALNSVGSLLDFWEPGPEPTPNADGSFHVVARECTMPRPEHAWLLPLLPVVRLPGADEPWVADEHLKLLLSRLSSLQRDPRERVDPALLAGWLAQPAPGPLPYRRPRCRGDVTQKHIGRFFDCFPELAAALRCMLGWGAAGGACAPAKYANSLARRLLGFPVDLRAGELVIDHMYSLQVTLACGSRYIGGEPLIDLMFENLGRRLPRVKMPARLDPDDSRHGAAWSCDVNRMISDPKVWGISPRRRPAGASCPR